MTPFSSGVSFSLMVALGLFRELARLDQGIDLFGGDGLFLEQGVAMSVTSPLCAVKISIACLWAVSMI
jgi:hypothetical protein